MILVIFNITIVSFSVSWTLYKISNFLNVKVDLRSVQSPLELIRDIFISHTIIQEVCMYYVHRILHLQIIYKQFHKIHHEYKSPISFLAAYAHPIEHIFLNMLPSIAGPLILRSPISTVWVYIAFSTFIGINDHCGYQFPFLTHTEIHDMHHQKFKFNFAGNGWLDYLHSTLYLKKLKSNSVE
jgi:fatty acid hydroxylase domain-containing protein 2